MADQVAPAPVTQASAPAAQAAPAAQSQPSGAEAPGTGQIMAPQAAALAAHAAASADAGLNAELDSAIQEHQDSVRGGAGKPRQDDAKPEENATPAQDGAAVAAPVAESPTATEKPAEKPPEDPAAVRIAQYLRDQRAARAAKKQADEAAVASRAATEAANAKAAAAEAKTREAQELAELAKTNPVAAIRKLVGDKRLSDETIIMDVIGALKDGVPEETQLTKEQEIALAAEKAAAAVQAKLKADREAEETKAAEEAKAQVARAKEAYFAGLASEFETNRNDYPYVDAKGFDVPEADRWMNEVFNQTRRVPTGKEVLDHFESRAKAEAERLLAVHQRRLGVTPQPTAASAAPARSAHASPPTSAVDSRGRVSAPNSNDDYHARREKLMNSL